MKPAILLLIIILLPAELSAQDSESQQIAQWIMNIVVQKGLANEKIKRENITYDKTVVKYDLDSHPERVKEKLVYSVYGRNGKSMEQIKEKNGKSINGSRAETSKLNFNEILLNRYDFNLEKEIFSEGRGYYVISFKPKEPIDKLPFNDRMDEGINRTSGYIHVDMEKFYLRKLSGRLTNRFSKVLNIFEMKEFSIDFEQEEFGNIIVPKSMTLTFKYRVFLGDTNEKLEYTYSNRRASPPK